MSYIEKAWAIMRNWNKEEFIKINRPDYMLIRETEFISLNNERIKWKNG